MYWTMLEGINIVGFSGASQGTIGLKARNAATLEDLPEKFVAATEQEVAQAVQLAATAAPAYAETAPEQRAQFLEAIAEEIEALGDALLARASAESGLPFARFQ
ncbi:MAG TPA: aldehyde dehydrogenase (NADP(+)), partial [Cytophagales bacterium]|nr:aldehyde dehydrogenase (NADP(+)) [Cytophagales bacterium]